MRQQERCHVVYAKSLHLGYVNSHGFELSRTVWYSQKRLKRPQIIEEIGPFLVPQRLIVTLNVPTFPLLSNVRNEMVCSPGPSCPNSTV